MSSRAAFLLTTLLALPLLAATPQLPVGGFGRAESFAPQIAAGGSGYLVTWLELDSENFQRRLYGSRVSRDGQLLDGGGVLLAAEDPISCRVKFDGTNYIVAFTTEHRASSAAHLRVLTISPESGAVVRDVIIPLASGYDLALEVSPAATFLAWLDSDATLQLARISNTTGIVERASLPVGQVAYPALSWNGSSLLVAWNTMRLVIGSPMMIFPEAVYAARVSDALTMLDAAPALVETVDGAGAMEESAPSVASNGHEWLVTWGHGSTIHATRILPDGVHGSVMDIARGEAPLVFRNGDRYALAWSETVPPTGELRRLFVANLVDADGLLVSSSPHTAAAVPFFGGVSSVAGSNRDVAVAWGSASAPEFDWQASFRIMDAAAGRRRSVR